MRSISTRTAYRRPGNRGSATPVGALLVGGSVLALAGAAAAQPADQKAQESPSVETAVPAAQTSGLTVTPTAEDNWDRNDDGRINKDEFATYFEKGDVFQRFDDDGSGLIEPDEFEVKMFRMIDDDANAKLDDMEWRAADRWDEITPFGVFENFDDDNDGMIDRAEFRAMPQNRELFEAWDVDGDGEVTPDELRAGLYETVDFNERNPLAALLDEEVGDDEQGQAGRDTGPIRPNGEGKDADAEPSGGGGGQAAAAQTNAWQTAAQTDAQDDAADENGAARTPPGGGSVTDTAPDTGAEAAAAPAACADKVERLQDRADAYMSKPENEVKDQTVTKVRNLMLRATTFCESGNVAQAAELTDNVRELLGMK